MDCFTALLMTAPFSVIAKPFRAEAIHKQKELESTIDSLVYDLYNLSDDEIEIVEY